MRKNDNQTSFFENFNQAYYTTDGYDDYLKRFIQEGQDCARRLIKVIEPDLGWRFLDVGCGMGGMILAIRKLGFKAWGTEVSPFCLQSSPAKKWMRYGDVCSLPYPDNFFDVVACVDVFCYLNRKEVMQAAKELTRITKHYLYIESICKGSPNSNQKLNPDLLRKDKYLLTPNEFRTLFEKNGTLFLEALYSKEELGDFSGVFVK